MERIGFTMQLLPGAEAEYRRRHAAVWPEMLAELRPPAPATTRSTSEATTCSATSRSTTSSASGRHMDASAVNARWQAEMASLIDPLTDPATGFHRQTRRGLPP